MIAMLVLGCSGGGNVDIADTGTPTVDTYTPTVTDTGSVDPGGPFVGVHDARVAGYGSVIRVGWTQTAAADVHLEYSFDPGRWLSSPSRQLGKGDHEELLLGIPYATDVTYRLVADGEPSTEIDARTGDQPPTIPVVEIVAHDPAAVDPDVPYLLVGVTEYGGWVGRTWVMLIDRQGRVLWAHRTPNNRNAMQPQLSYAGDSFLVDYSSWFADLGSAGADSQVVELKIDGTLVHTWDTPGAHHPFTQLPDGSIAYAGYTSGSYADERIEIVRPSGLTETFWSCRDWLATRAPGLTCGSNTLVLDEERGVFLVSEFRFNSVFEIDASTAEVLRIYGDLGNGVWPDYTGLDAWTFSPTSAFFDYQHGPHFTPTGTLLVSTQIDRDSTELVVREYDVDDSTHTLRQVWSFGTGQGVVGCQTGEARRLPGGNTLHNYGTNARLREIAPDRQVVWDVRWESRQNGCFGGRDTPGHDLLSSIPVGPDLYRFAPPRP